MRQFHCDFYCFFRFFGLDFCINGFPNPVIVRSRSSFLFSQWKFFELYVKTCPPMFFLFRTQFLLRPDDVTTTSNLLFVHSFMQFQLNCMRGVIFRSYWSEFFLFICLIKLKVTLDLLHSRKWLPHFEIDFHLLQFKEIWSNWCVSL